MIKGGNIRILITLDKESIERLEYLTKFLSKSKSNTIRHLLEYYYDKLK